MKEWLKMADMFLVGAVRGERERGATDTVVAVQDNAVQFSLVCVSIFRKSPPKGSKRAKGKKKEEERSEKEATRICITFKLQCKHAM